MPEFDKPKPPDNLYILVPNHQVCSNAKSISRMRFFKDYTALDEGLYLSPEGAIVGSDVVYQTTSQPANSNYWRKTDTLHPTPGVYGYKAVPEPKISKN